MVMRYATLWGHVGASDVGGLINARGSGRKGGCLVSGGRSDLPIHPLLPQNPIDQRLKLQRLFRSDQRVFGRKSIFLGGWRRSGGAIGKAGHCLASGTALITWGLS